MDRKFIEDRFPVKEVSQQSAREKSIRHGHISTMHLWWARRPLSSSRATIYASLIPTANNKNFDKTRDFIIELCKWENSLNQNLLEQAKNEILKAYNGKAPKVLDPFSGGGAIPLEAMRLGCETYATDYNPVAVLLEKCTLEYPQLYNNNEKWSESNSILSKDVQKWGKIVLNEIKSELNKFYPSDEYGNTPVGFVWTRTIKCLNPNCGCEIPLMKQFWLAKKNNRKIAIMPKIKSGNVEFEIVGQETEIPEDFNPDEGTIKRSVGFCLSCKSTIDAKSMRKLFKEHKYSNRLICTVYNSPNKKIYKIPINKDFEAYNNAVKYLISKKNDLKNKFDSEIVPNETIPLMSGTFNVPLYGFETWGDLFNYRQQLVLVSFVEKIRDLYKELSKKDQKNAKVILSYLSLAFDRLADYNSSMTRWVPRGEYIGNTFTRQALPMVWEHFELCPWSEATGDWNSAINWIVLVIEHLTKISNHNMENIPFVSQASASKLPYPDEFFDAVFTDPPYYNSVPYADLSDFFYVWLKSLLWDVFPELFLTPLTPKTDEIVEMAGWDKIRYKYKDKNFFESKLKISFKEIYRVLKSDGIVNIVYAHKTTEGWETVINALLDSGLTVTASWPISTEMKVRLRAKNSAALASSIYIIARKTDKKEIGWLKNVKQEIRHYIPQKLDKLWNEDIFGADFFIAAIGSSIEVFGKYEKIIDFEGNEIRADKLLGFVRDVVTDYAMKQILHNGIAGILSPLTKFYLLWRWNYQETRVPFDEARKLAQSAGIDLSNQWNKGFIVKSGQYIIVLGPEKRKEKDLEEPIELIDTLHSVSLLWNKRKTEDMKNILEKTGWGNDDAFYRVAQAIAETLDDSSSEKKLIQGFLASKDKIMKDMRDEGQRKLV